MIALLLSVPAAWPCGGFVPQAGSLSSSDAQQVLFELGDTSLNVTYRARYTGNAADFAWVIAVPGEVLGVDVGDAALLDELEALSAPEVEVDPAVAGAGGCGCAGETDGGTKGGVRANGDFDTGGGVTVEGSGFAGDYAYTILGASDAGSLVGWLDDNGYDSSMIAPAIGTYVSDPLDWAFVAVRYAPDVQGQQDGVMLEPLRIAYGPAADGKLHAIFPGQLGQSSTAAFVHTETYILGESRAALGGGWSAPDNPDEKNGHTWDVATVDYGSARGAWLHLLSEYGHTERGMWMTWSGSRGGGWLTRYDSYLLPATYSADPVFAESGDQVTADTRIFMMAEVTWEQNHNSEEAVLAIGVGSLGFLAWRRRRNG
jgi:hypothetical protein